jgi:hypothetical protein
MMRQALWAEFCGTTGLLTVAMGSDIMGERLADEHCSVLLLGTGKEIAA